MPPQAHAPHGDHAQSVAPVLRAVCTAGLGQQAVALCRNQPVTVPLF
jgi:hypothetical protein